MAWRARSQRPPVTHCLGWCFVEVPSRPHGPRGVGDQRGKEEMGLGTRRPGARLTVDEEPFR